MNEDRVPARRFEGADEQPGSETEETRPAFYAARSGSWGDWWTLLHPPYTAWHLAYVVIGASLAPLVNATKLVATVLAFFLAVGLAAHALDELKGRPLRTGIPDWVLGGVAAVALAGAVALGIAGVIKVGWVLVPFLVIGPVLVVGYCSELMGGVLHNDLTFGIAWGAFPVLTAYVAQTDRLTAAAVLAALAALGLFRRPADAQHAGTTAAPEGLRGRRERRARRAERRSRSTGEPCSSRWKGRCERWPVP